jgi:hypothetical protein
MAIAQRANRTNRASQNCFVFLRRANIARQPDQQTGGKIRMTSESLKTEGPTLQAEAGESPTLDAIFDAHIAREFADRDVDATMATMVAEPYVHCVPIMTGGSGSKGVRRFYGEHLEFMESNTFGLPPAPLCLA